MNTYLGLDLGTSMIKATIINDDGNILATGSRPTTLITPQENFAEQSTQEWWNAICEIIKDLGNKVDISTLKGIGLSGQMHGLVMYNNDKVALGNAIVWLDKRSHKQVDEILKIIKEEEYYKITGNPLFTGLLLPSLLWIKQNQNELFQKIDKISSPKDFIALSLTGVLRTEPTDALATGAFDYKKNQWANTVLEKINIPLEIFPECKPTIEAYGTVSVDAAKNTGLPSGIPVYGGSDQSMAALGIGLVEKSHAGIAISTGGQFLVVGEKGIVDDKKRLHTLNHAIDSVGLYMAATLTAGLSLQWFKDNIVESKDLPFEKLLENVESVKIGDAPFFLPFLAGERTPYFNSDLRGAFIGLSLTHKKQHMVRSIMEGVGFSIKACLEVFKDLQIPITKIVLSGGGVKHDLWKKILANTINMPIEIINISDHSPFGAAIIAKFAQQNFLGLDEFYKKNIELVETVKPEDKIVAEYDKLFEQYQSFAGFLNSQYTKSHKAYGSRN